MRGPQETVVADPSPASPARQRASAAMPGLVLHAYVSRAGLPVLDAAAAQRHMTRAREAWRIRQANAEAADRQAALERYREAALRRRRAHEAEDEARLLRATRPPPLAMPSATTPTTRRAIASSAGNCNLRSAAGRRAMQAEARRGSHHPEYAPGVDNNAAAAPNPPAAVVSPLPDEIHAPPSPWRAVPRSANGRTVERAPRWPIVRPPYSADTAAVPALPYPLASVEGLPVLSLPPSPACILPSPPSSRAARAGRFAVPTAGAAAAIAASVARERASPALEPSSLDVRRGSKGRGEGVV